MTTMDIRTTAGSPFACNPIAMNAEQSTRYMVLMKVLDLKGRPMTELSDGFSFVLPKSPSKIREVAEWMTYEMLCCPFLSFSLDVAASEEAVLIGLRGPEGIKSFIRNEFDLQ